jgi:iron(III) transport system substrate-binding protein
VNISGIAMTKSAPNKAEAQQLMEFLVSAEAQEIYADVNNEYPVLDGAPLSDLVASWGTYDVDDIDLTEVAGHRAAALRIMEEVNFDG